MRLIRPASRRGFRINDLVLLATGCTLEHVRRIWMAIVAVGLAFVVFVLLIAVLWVHYLKDSAFYAAALGFASGHPGVHQAIGDVRGVSGIPFGYYRESEEERDGDGNIILFLRGETGRGYIVLSAYRNFAHWVVERANIHFGGGTKTLDTVDTLFAKPNDLTTEELEERFKLATVVQPAIPEPYYIRGSRYLTEEKYKEAEAAFREAISRDGTYGPAYNDMGITLMRQKRYPDAMEALSTAHDLMPDDSYPFINKAVIYMEARDLLDLKKSREMLDEAIKMDPDEPIIYDTLADLEAKEGHHDLAKEAREKAKRLREKE